jgi:hypothetical protein
MPQYQGISDNSLPLIPKPSLQQYDNYQIYDVCCNDEIKETYVDGEVVSTDIKKFNHFLAIQAYSVVPIISDFIEVVNTYP